jgi:hypothetical protein
MDPVLGSLVYQLPGGITLAYDLRLERTIDRCKGISEDIHFGGSIKGFNTLIEVLDPKKSSFRPSKWPRKFRNQKTAKNSKLLEDCFEPVGIGGWPPISTWINVLTEISCILIWMLPTPTILQEISFPIKTTPSLIDW